MNKLLAIIFSFQLIVTPVVFAQAPAVPGGQASQQFRASVAPDGVAGAMGGNGVPFWINQILALATSTIGENILTTCALGSKQPSLWLFMAGAVGNIISEIVMSTKQNDIHKKIVADIALSQDKMKEAGVQKESLEAAKKNENENKAIIETRIVIAAAVSAVYLAATIAAIVEFNTTTAASAVSFGAAGNVYDTNGCFPNFEYGKILTKGLVLAWTAAAGFGLGQGGIVANVGAQIPSVLSLLGMSKGLDKVVFLTYEKAAARIVTFGAAALLQGGIIAGLGERLITVNENISKLDLVIKDLPKDENGITPPPEPETTGDSNGGGDKPTPPKLLPKSPVKTLNCVAKDASSVSPAACREPYRFQDTKNRPDFKLDILSNTMNSAQDMVNSLARGDIGKAKLEAAGIAANAGRLRAIRDDLLKKTNEKLIAEGKKPIDFNKAVQNQLNGMVSDLNKVVAAKGIDVAALSKSMGDSKSTKALKPATSANVFAPGAAAPSTPGIDLSTPSEEPEAIVTTEAPTEKSLNDYDLNEQDVSKDKSVSIFKQLSNRYILNYKKIFKTIDEPKSETIPLAPSTKK